MTQKECDPRCTGKCNKRKSLPVSTASKGCDPKCTGRCSKKNAGVSPLDSIPPAVIPPLITPLEIKELDNIGDNKIGPQSKLLQPGDVNFIIMDLDGIILGLQFIYKFEKIKPNLFIILQNPELINIFLFNFGIT